MVDYADGSFSLAELDRVTAELLPKFAPLLTNKTALHEVVEHVSSSSNDLTNNLNYSIDVLVMVEILSVEWGDTVTFSTLTC